MKDRDISLLTRGLAPVLRDYVLAALMPLAQRIAELEKREPSKGDKGDKGDSVDVGEITRIAREAVSAAISTTTPEIIAAIKATIPDYIPAPEKGAKGDKGDDANQVTPEQIAEQVAAYLKANPPPKGDPGEAGDDAEPVTDEQIAAAVSKHLTANPPRDGKDGDSIKGDEGRGIKEALIDADGDLVLTFTDGAIKTVGRVEGKDGKDGLSVRGEAGVNGKDGFSAEHMTASLEGDRTIVLSYVRGTETKEFGRLVLPYQFYKGVFREGQNYVQGDTVTHGGSTWHCNEDTAEKPGLSKAWTLSVKAGRDGKDGKLIPVKPREPIKI